MVLKPLVMHFQKYLELIIQLLCASFICEKAEKSYLIKDEALHDDDIETLQLSEDEVFDVATRLFLENGSTKGNLNFFNIS